jgi:hypothetical protein
LIHVLIASITDGIDVDVEDDGIVEEIAPLRIKFNSFVSGTRGSGPPPKQKLASLTDCFLF